MTKGCKPACCPARRAGLITFLGITGALFLPVFFAIGAALAATLEGTVIKVSDGDTIQVQDATGIRHKIRLHGIDAPETAQSFGPESGAWLRARVLSKTVRVEWQVHDRYQRVVGQVFNAEEDIGLALLQHGLAWHYRAYAKDQTPTDRATYAAAETEARAAQRALWAAENPTPPWAWRRMQRQRPQTQAAATLQTPSPPPHWID